MILGTICTRSCRFCGVPKGSPRELDPGEPDRVADAVASLHLKYAVVTSVTRDDLADGGSSLFAATIRAIRTKTIGCRVEVLIPDFKGSESSLGTVLDASPDVLDHNIETVPALYPAVRPQADYQRSLALPQLRMKMVRSPKQDSCSVSEKPLQAGRSCMISGGGCSIPTLGQYLQPGKYHIPVEKYYHPDEFARFVLRHKRWDFGTSQPDRSSGVPIVLNNTGRSIIRPC
jgi:lipoic acid synthetase